MSYKTIRNQVLKDANRLITATYHGEPWSCPGEYFMIHHDLYADLKLRSYHQVESRQPVADKIVDRPELNYTKADVSIDEDGYTWLWSPNSRAKINTLYLDLLKSLWPKCTPWIATNSPYRIETEPVRVYNGSELVGVIMPVKT